MPALPTPCRLSRKLAVSSRTRCARGVSILDARASSLTADRCFLQASAIGGPAVFFQALIYAAGRLGAAKAVSFPDQPRAFPLAWPRLVGRQATVFISVDLMARLRLKDEDFGPQGPGFMPDFVQMIVYGIAPCARARK